MNYETLLMYKVILRTNLYCMLNVVGLRCNRDVYIMFISIVCLFQYIVYFCYFRDCFVFMLLQLHYSYAVNIASISKTSRACSAHAIMDVRIFDF